MKKPLIYLASPFTARYDDKALNNQVEQRRHQQVSDCTSFLIKSGHHVFSPIVYTIALLAQGLNLGKTFDFWRDFDLNMIDGCDELWVLCIEGWNLSVGVRAEIDWAKHRQLPVRYLVPRAAGDYTLMQGVPAELEQEIASDK